MDRCAARDRNNCYRGPAYYRLCLTVWKEKRIWSGRYLPERFSNGDENEVLIRAKSSYSFTVYIEVIDEVPFQFQLRDISFTAILSPGVPRTIGYQLRPVKRGEYDFGQLNIYARSPLGLAVRRYRFGKHQMIPVYPSYLQMRRYQLLAISNRLSEIGVKKMAHWTQHGV